MWTGGRWIHVTYDRCDFLLYGTLLPIYFGWWPVTSRCNRSSGFVAPRTSWGSWRAREELWGFSGAPRVGFGTFWGDLGGSQGGVQSLLLGGKHVTTTELLELGRFSVTCRSVWIFFDFSLCCWVWCLWIGEVNSLCFSLDHYVIFKKTIMKK